MDYIIKLNSFQIKERIDSYPQNDGFAIDPSSLLKFILLKSVRFNGKDLYE